MKIIKTLLITFLLSDAATCVTANTRVIGIFNETPSKTICIKNAQAADADKFFSTSTTVMFEVYKAGSKEEVAKIVKSLQSDSNVESVNAGNLTGDYQAITITLKSHKDKAWFIKEFKKVGLNHIKINNNPVIEVDKM